MGTSKRRVNATIEPDFERELSELASKLGLSLSATLMLLARIGLVVSRDTQIDLTSLSLKSRSNR